MVTDWKARALDAYRRREAETLPREQVTYDERAHVLRLLLASLLRRWPAIRPDAQGRPYAVADGVTFYLELGPDPVGPCDYDLIGGWRCPRCHQVTRSQPITTQEQIGVLLEEIEGHVCPREEAAAHVPVIV